MDRRHTLDLTRDELADKIGCAPITIAKIERDERRPSRQMAELLADALLPPSEDRERFVLWARGVPANKPILEFPVGAATTDKPSLAGGGLATEAAPARFNNLPYSLTSFVGRESDMAKARSILWRSDVRLLTLTGPPGIGKTRLSMAIAASAGDDFEQGLCWVPLAPISDPDLVAYTIAQSLGIAEAAHTDPLKTLQAYLHSRRMLLLLDNFEQIMPAATVVSSLLSTCPSLKVIVTSRERLHIYGEHEYPLAPLEVPDPDQPAIAEAYPSVALFVQRAQAVNPSFDITAENQRDVVEICRKLDGLPLAIELAAARVRFLSPSALLARLDNRLSILTGGARDLPPRQQTLRGAISWSYELLSEREKTLFNLLGVFVGGCTLEDIAAVADTDPGDPDLLDALASLLDKSLVNRDDGRVSGGIAPVKHEPRYTMLEMIREYACAQLDESGQGVVVRQKHFSYFHSLAVHADDQFYSQDQIEWMELIELNKDNFRSALRWTLDSGQSTDALKLACALWGFWYLRLYVNEGLHWIQEALASAEDAPPPLRADGLFACGAMMIGQDEYALAKPYLEQALRIYTQLDDTGSVGRCMNGLALAHLQLGETAEAHRLFEQSIAVHTEAGETARLALAHSNFSYSLLQTRRYEEAIVQSNIAMKLREDNGDIGGVGSSQLILGGIALHQGNFDYATGLLEKSVEVNLAVGDRRDAATGLVVLGLSSILQGDLEAARDLYDRGLALYRGMGNTFGIARVMIGYAGIASAKGDHDWAVRMCGAILKYYEMILTRITPIELDLYNKVLSDASKHLGDATVNALMYEGGQIGIDNLPIQ